MTPSNRPACPTFLAQNWRQWGIDYSEKRGANRTYKFQWKTWENTPVNQLLLEPLSEMTAGHCAYCDWFPTDCGTDPTIDHFKPKTRFPLEAYAWPNLYLACRQCQRKADSELTEAQFNLLLRPDESEYSFEKFFIYKYLTGEIEPNPRASSSNYHRAELTIRVLRLNSEGRPAARKRMLSVFEKLDDASQSRFKNEQPFRFLLSQL